MNRANGSVATVIDPICYACGSCNGTGQYCSKDDILKPRSSSYVSAGISGLGSASEIWKKHGRAEPHCRSRHDLALGAALCTRIKPPLPPRAPDDNPLLEGG